MTADPTTAGEDLFWELADPLLDRPDVTRSTMMGYPCLRIAGQYFASTHHGTGELIVKLPEARVDELVDTGAAQPFAPGGKRFREWAAVPDVDRRRWSELLDEALAFVATLPPERVPKRTPQRRAAR